MRSDQILDRTTQRLDETTLLEQGRKVERGLWDENTRNKMLTDHERLRSLLSARHEVGRTYATWNETKERLVNLEARRHYTPFSHDLECDCRPCNAAWKRLFSDLLPKRHQAGQR